MYKVREQSDYRDTDESLLCDVGKGVARGSTEKGGG